LSTGDFRQLVNHFVQCDSRAGSAIKDDPGSARYFRRAKSLIDHILDVRKISRLLAIPVDHWRVSLQHCQHEPGQHAGIRRGGILPGPEHVKIAHTRMVKTVDSAEYLGIEFSNVFRNSVRRNRGRLHDLNLWERWSLTVSGGRGSIHNAFYFC